MKSNLYKITFFAWVFMPLLAFSQANEVDKILRRAPEITSFMKVGEYPVSYYTGTPDISIPLFTLKEGEFSMPIDLSYAGTAVPVSEPSTWVGQNWNLFPGGYITRIVVGTMNENSLATATAHQEFLKKKNTNQSQLLESYSNGVYGDVAFWNPVAPWANVFSGGTPSQPDFQAGDGGTMEDIAAGNDFQPDIYSYNILGYSGKFYFDDNKNIISLNQQDHLIFEDLRAGNASNGWKVTLPNGIQVFLAAFDYSTPFSSSLAVNGNQSHSWKVSGITLLNGNSITFIYTAKAYNQYYNADVAHLNYVDANDTKATQDLNQGQWNPDGDYTVGALRDYNSYNSVYLTKIESPNYVINFDLSADVKPRLNDITWYNKSNPQLVKKYSFSYNPYKLFGSSWDDGAQAYLHYSGDAVYQRYKLSALTESSVVNGVETVNSPYTFEYVEDKGLPSILSRSQDYWGYFNGYANSISFPDMSAMFSNYSFTNIGSIPAGTLQTLKSVCTAKRGVDTTYLKQGILRKIVYPTKGSTVFNYEPHVFNYPGAHILTLSELLSQNYTGSNSAASIGGGLRIKDIINYDNNGNFASRKKFSYQAIDGGASGLLFVPLNFWQLTPQETCQGFYHRFSSSSSNSNETPLIPYNFGYSSVIIYDSSTSSDTPGETLNGKAIHNFYNTSLGYNMPFNYPYLTTLDKRNGLPTYTAYYDNNNTPVKREDYTYTKVDSSLYTSISLTRIFSNCSGSNKAFGNNVYVLNYSDMIGETWKQSSIKETTYAGANTYQEVTNLSYTTDSYHLLLKKQQQRSKDDVLNSILYLYPSDYTNSSGFIADMKAKRIMNKPVEQVNYLQQGSSINITGGHLITYKTDNNAGLPDTEYSLETATLLPLTNFRFSNQNISGVFPTSGVPGNYTLNTTYYKSKLYYSGYDNYRNPLGYQITGAPSVDYLWAYDKQYPVAKFENAALNQVAYSSCEEALTDALEDFNGTNISFYTDNSSFYSSDCHTGKRSFNLTDGSAHEITTSTQLPSGTYIFSYWSKGTGTGNGSTVSLDENFIVRNSIDVNANAKGWEYHEAEINVPVDDWFTIYPNEGGNSILIDDIRICPKGSLSTTFTYDPLVGITSSTDAKGMTTTYEYDDLQRLMNIKDKDGNIIKHMDYHYQNQ